MTLQFVVLASGSAGNASFVEADGVGFLLDFGLGPRQLSARLAAAGLSWERLRAVLLTHTHTDHWHERTLLQLKQRGIPLHCHPQHERSLKGSLAFRELQSAGLVRHYEANRWQPLTPRLAFLPFRVSHDGGLTCGFRIEGPVDFFGEPVRLAYAADLGSWDAALVPLLAEVDILALEFNHDVELQRLSGRSPSTIARVLGDQGHLSNVQAASLVREVLRHSTVGRPRDIVQLHLSRDCNRPELARAVLETALGNGRSNNLRPRIHTARQDQIGPNLRVDAVVRSSRPRRRRNQNRPGGLPPRPGSASDGYQTWLPGWNERDRP